MILKLFISFIYLCYYIELLCQWSDDKNGMYHIWYVPQKAGAVMMLVRLNSQPILGGGFFQIAVSEAAAPVVEVSPSFSGVSFFFFILYFGLIYLFVDVQHAPVSESSTPLSAVTPERRVSDLPSDASLPSSGGASNRSSLSADSSKSSLASTSSEPRQSSHVPFLIPTLFLLV